MSNYEHLYTPNNNLVSRVFGSEFAGLAALGVLSPALTLEANEALAEVLYGSEVAGLLRAGHIAELDKLGTDNLQEVSVLAKELESLDPRSIGLVVVRPEIVGLWEDCRRLLVSRGLEILADRPIEVTFSQYWAMYHHGLVHPDAYHDFPTRTLNYVDKPSHLMIVTAGPEVTDGLAVGDYLATTVKGRQGSVRQDTLRGDIAYYALLPSVSRIRRGAFNTASDNIAHDPIGAYQHLVRGNIPSDGMHNTADEPLLFYAAQGVHVPDATETIRDLSILYTESEQVMLVERLSSSKA